MHRFFNLKSVYHFFAWWALPVALALLIVSTNSRVADAQKFTTLHVFRSGSTDGRACLAALIRAADGSFYGTTELGGAYDLGTVFRLDVAGHETLLHSFNGSDGGYPDTGLIQATDGNFYGTTQSYAYGIPGIAFKMNRAGHVTVLHSFFGSGSGWGPGPLTGLIQASDGNFYGATFNGGSDFGSLFKMDMAGNVTTLHLFSGTDGNGPRAALMQASDGNLYGTTSAGGVNNTGTIFRLGLNGAFTQIHSFSAVDSSYRNADGAYPWTPLIQAHDGNLYTTAGGGANGQGTVLKISMQGAVTMLYSFTDGVYNFVDGYRLPALVQTSDGNLYGTTSGGGASNVGTIYKISTAGTLTFLHSFDGTDGSTPGAALMQSSDGSLWSTTSDGGAFNSGGVFKMDMAGNVTVVHAFRNAHAEGFHPSSGVIQAHDGKLYGTTAQGGESYLGSSFRSDLSGNATPLHSFELLDGTYPGGDRSFIQGSDGDFYGSTSGGGEDGLGTFYRVGADGTLTVLTSAANAGGPLCLANDGNIYGIGNGGVFKVDPAGNVTTALTFGATGGPTHLFQASDGDFYGTVLVHIVHIGRKPQNYYLGTLFKVDLAAGNVTAVHSYDSRSDAGLPEDPLIQADDGDLYGINQEFSQVFKMDLAGNLTVVHNFGSGEEYAGSTGLIQASDGNFYGTAGSFENGDEGAVFKMDRKGHITVLHVFRGTDGIAPSGLIQASDGNLYGTTFAGGGPASSNAAGTLFQIELGSYLNTLSVKPSTVLGGANATGKVSLTASSGSNTVISLASSSGVAAVPNTVTIPAGQTSATFPIITTSVTVSTTVKITAAANGVAKSVNLTVTP